MITIIEMFVIINIIAIFIVKRIFYVEKIIVINLNNQTIFNHNNNVFLYFEIKYIHFSFFFKNVFDVFSVALNLNYSEKNSISKNL